MSGQGDKASQPAQLHALTGIRGLAAWLVVLFHVRVTLVNTLPGWLMHAANKGYLAVDLFFILSGFVLWYNYADRLRGTGLSGAGLFWWRRIARIWPLHAVVLGVFVALALLLVATGRDTTPYPFHELPLHILLIQNWGFTPSLAWNDPAWSISCEMGAYMVFPMVVAVCRWDRLPTWALLGIAGGLIAGIWAFFAAVGSRYLGYHIPLMGPGRCLMEFSLGNIVCMVWQRWRHGPVAYAWGALGVAVVVLVGGVALGLPETSVVPLGFAALILALALNVPGGERLLGGQTVRYLGEISYSTYLAHYLLFVLFKMAFVRNSPILGLAQLGAFAMLVLAASVILYHGVEKPAQRWLNALVRPRRAVVTA